ncbi:hypothetical protein C8J56DRAFT_1102157 [Mycena floridula]|nr:hypothetical protein C8J56DRAFT_1102157 [Mycena floridula]
MLFKFTQITSFFLFSLTVGSAVASPALDNAALAKRDNADVLAVLNTLKGSTDTILPQISSAVTAGPTEETLTPLINDLTTALNDRDFILGWTERYLSSWTQETIRRRNCQLDCHNRHGLVGDLATIPGLGGLLSGVDLALSQVLKGVEVLLAGVLNLVATLLVDVAALLTSLAFGLTLASIGL